MIPFSKIISASTFSVEALDCSCGLEQGLYMLVKMCLRLKVQVIIYSFQNFPSEMNHNN